MAEQLNNYVLPNAADGLVARGLAQTSCTFFNAFDSAEPVGNVAGNLPHWRQQGATYFVTFRTADSLPREKLEIWLRDRAEWLKRNPEPHSARQRQEYWERFPARIQYWLDQGYGASLLGRSGLREIVEGALWHFHGQRYDLRDEVVMPNHVHVIITPAGDYSLSAIVQSWKSFTAHQINKALRRSGTLWQKESFDHIVRNVYSLEKFKIYLEANRQCRRDLRSRAFVT